MAPPELRAALDALLRSLLQEAEDAGLVVTGLPHEELCGPDLALLGDMVAASRATESAAVSVPRQHYAAVQRLHETMWQIRDHEDPDGPGVSGQLVRAYHVEGEQILVVLGFQALADAVRRTLSH